MRSKLIAMITLVLSLNCFAETDTDEIKTNEGNRSSDRMTADQRTLRSSDAEITRRIRQDIMKEKNLSTYVQNVCSNRLTITEKGDFMNDKNKVVLGIYKTRTEVERGIDELKSDGYLN
ncbi:MAG TPA: hypothetical protein PLJ21_03545 [Pseudobdellovibrionaceae bacterium]|nr:hypothetical protein [Pseudobdellovibrionaceae bacterium]